MGAYLFMGPMMAAIGASVKTLQEQQVEKLKQSLLILERNRNNGKNVDFYDDAIEAITFNINKAEAEMIEEKRLAKEIQHKLQREEDDRRREQLSLYLKQQESARKAREKQEHDSLQKRLAEKYIQESREQYPHAWHLSDWVDDIALMLKELEEFKPL